ncbi:membrane protein [Ectothiorhodospira haloalkaliphila]|uniref:Membrane protein n=1 Tax=Ectothiorhodospira haloalkaliphila TaxID=421628 RepID=W8KTU3_9GAMM|nr:exosortase A [Ectothiorhodospira haloalkaliphila]AHK79001.1 membrane protein [Ectothiorhodospira haloalkaliphila]
MNTSPSSTQAQPDAPAPIKARKSGLPWPLALGLLAAAFLAMLALYWPSVQSLVGIWANSDTYAHGMVILPISLFLAWTQRHRLAQVTPSPSLFGALVILALGVGWFLARAADVTVVQTFVVVAMVPALVLAILGWQVSRVLIFPLAYLFFAWPVGNFLVPILQDYTAWFTVWMLRASGIPTFSEGYYISIPAGDFVVAEVCSGIRYLIASVALGLVYAYLVYRSIWRRLAFVALSILVPIVANGLRAYGIIMIAHWTNMEHAVGVDHLIYGWLFFGFVMFLLFWIGTFFRDDHEPLSAKVKGEDAAPGAGTGLPLTRSLASHATPIVAVVVALALAPSGETWLDQRMAALAGDLRPEAPLMAGWDGPETLDEAPWNPRWAEPDTRLQVAYASPRGHMEWHVYHYRHDQPGTDLIRYDNRIFDGDRWRRISQGSQNVTLPDGSQRPVRETLLRGREGNDRVVWHWYQVAGQTTVRPIEVKLLEASARLTGHREGSLLVVVSAEYEISADEARDTLAGFLEQSPRRVAVVESTPQVAADE